MHNIELVHSALSTASQFIYMLTRRYVYICESVCVRSTHFPEAFFCIQNILSFHILGSFSYEWLGNG